jgi:signal transduction histidine kinase/ligand-binding sensor domain-containing protein
LTDGLSESTIRGITEDAKGFMWFGTEDGLNRYDGYEFKIYRTESANPYSLSSSNIKDIFHDSKGNLWILSRDGVNLYDKYKDCFYNYKNKKYTALSNLNIDAEYMAEDYQGNYWIAGNEEGIFRISDLKKPAERFSSLLRENGNIFISIHPMKDGTLLLGSLDGLILFNPSTKAFTDLRPKYGSGYQVRNFHEDKKNNIWIATTNGLKIIRSDGSMKEYFNIPSNPKSMGGNNLTDVIQYREGNYLIAIDGGGIDYFDSEKEIFYHYKDENESQLSSNNVTSLFVDSKGDLWAGTYLNGINFSNSTTNLFVLIKNNPNSQRSIKKGIISRFFKDSKNNFWIATDGNGLYKKPFNSDEFIHYSPENTENIGNVFLSIYEDKDGLVWFSTYDAGICYYDPKKGKFTKFTHNPSDPSSISSNQIRDINCYKGKIWTAGFGTGISVLDPGTGKFHHHRYDKFYSNSIPSDWIQCITVDKNDKLWLGTFKGLAEYDPDKGSFKTYKTNDSYINYILDIYEDSKGMIWLGTCGGGLAYFNPQTKEIKNFTISNGLSDNTIKGILEDDFGYLWLSTNNGITRLNLKDNSIRPYSIKDGAPPVSYFLGAKYKDEDGKIYFGSNKGYVIIDPRMTRENMQPPPVVFTELKINNEIIFAGKNSPLKSDITEARELLLRYDQNSVTLKFAALNFNNSQNNQYLYLLEGFDNDWISSGNQRTATYTNLYPGKYIFRVKASNNDNVWNEEGMAIIISITPPFWKTWWFNSTIIFTFVGGLYGVYFWRTISIRRKNLKLERTVRKRTKELKDANEQLEAFVYKASHDIKGPLKSIIGLTTIGQKDIKDEAAKQYFDHILKSTKKLDNLLMDLLQITKVKQATIQKEKIDFNNLLNDVISSFSRFPGFENIKINPAVHSKADFHCDKKLLYSLIQNLVENPIKYQDPGKKNCYLDITITTDEKGANLVFEDNGLGIPYEYQKKVFDMFFKMNDSSNGTGLGLYIVKTTVEKLNGTISLESTPGKGSTFTVFLKN